MVYLGVPDTAKSAYTTWLTTVEKGVDNRTSYLSTVVWHLSPGPRDFVTIPEFLGIVLRLASWPEWAPCGQGYTLFSPSTSFSSKRGICSHSAWWCSKVVNTRNACFWPLGNVRCIEEPKNILEHRGEANWEILESGCFYLLCPLGWIKKDIWPGVWCPLWLSVNKVSVLKASVTLASPSQPVLACACAAFLTGNQSGLRATG